MSEAHEVTAAVMLRPRDCLAILRAARRLQSERLATRMEELGLCDLAQRLRRRSTPRMPAR